MKFDIKKRSNPNRAKYSREEYELAAEFAKSAYKEFGSFVKAIILFGSSARKEGEAKADVDVLMIVDDVNVVISPELTDTYRIITEKIVSDVSTKLHITTLRFTSFWEYIRAGDPIGINILRDGVSLIDTGFFDPMQILLYQGRIRPSLESIWVYYSRSPQTLHNSKWHIIQATLDLYWAVIDSSHAALMSIGEIPPSPGHVSDLLDERMAKKGLLNKKYVFIMKNFYELAKRIMHREIKEIKGEQYDRYFKDAQEYVEVMKKFIERRER